MFNKKDQKNTIEKLVSQQETEDRYILDDEDAIILIRNNNENTGYIMIHERLIDGKLVEINRWPMDIYYFGSIHRITPIEEMHLFKVQNNRGEFGSLYDYKSGKFIIPRETWQSIVFGCENEFLEKYNGILASFSISSDYEGDDVYSYDNQITGEKITESFRVIDGNYYAIIELDGTIRGNKLFKGSSFSKIIEIIDLDKYESLDEFKKERKQLCNDTKKRQKQEYYQMIETRNNGSISPYLDSEVAKILNLRK